MAQSIIDIKVVPKSSRSKITINDSGEIKVYLNSPPIDGKANAEVIKLFSKQLHIAKSKIAIIRGDKGKQKRLSIEGIDFDNLIKIITP